MKTFHLYHHYPDQLPLEEISDQTWLINNAMTYSLVATIEASSATEALQAAQLKAQERSVPRSVSIQVGNLFRETLPGDVLVAEYAAWMVDRTGHLQSIAYAASRPYKRLRQRSGQRSLVYALAWSPDGTILAASGDDRRVVLHVVATDQDYPHAYERGGYATKHLAWSPHGSLLASTGNHGEVHIWRPAPWCHDGALGSILLCRTEEASSSSVSLHCLAWSPDGIQILAGRDDGCLACWDARTGACVPLQQRHVKAITALAFSPRFEHLLLTASADATARIWDRTTQREVVYHHARGVTTAIWSPDGSLVASCEQADPAIHLWHPQTGSLVERIPLSLSSSKGLEVCALTWSHNGTYLAAGCDDSTIQIIEMEQHRHRHTYRVNRFARQKVMALAWSPDDTLLAAGDGSEGIDIWQADQDVKHPTEEPKRADAVHEA
jgi:WD40 repeat protein